MSDPRVWRIAGPSPPLVGRVSLPGGKNAALPLLLAAAGLPGPSRLTALPDGLGDVQAALALLGSTGAGRDASGLVGPSRSGVATHAAAAPSIRSTPVLLAALVGRHGAASVPWPGGCAIGDRDIALHVEVLRAFGLAVSGDPAAGLRAAGRLQSGAVHLRFPSTTASQVALLCAALAAGESRLSGLNGRPENRLLAAALAGAGAGVRWEASSDVAHVRGPARGGLDATVPTTVDEVLTWLVAGLLTGSGDRLWVGPFDDRRALTVLEAAGVALTWADGGVFAAPGALRPLRATFGGSGPGSDLQPVMAALALALPGTSELHDVRFPDRLAYAEGLQALGARVERLGGGRVAVTGGARLVGTALQCPDLRGGAALLLAGLWAEGCTTLAGVAQLERGYSALRATLAALGAPVEEVAPGA